MLQNRAGLVFESNRDPDYRLAAVVKFRETLERLRDLCQELELPMASLHASQLCQATAGPAGEILDTNGAERIASMLAVTTENELSLRRFFAVLPERAKYYCDDRQNPFGDAVASAFPSTSFDAAEAGRCFTFGRFTACVFHLMRVLEIGLCVLAKRFEIPSDHTNWQNIIEGIEKAVRNMASDPSKPFDWKDQQEFFSQAASHFMVAKDAWRNYTAHVRGKYTDEEAETLMINVRAFMQRLATRLSENSGEKGV